MKAIIARSYIGLAVLSVLFVIINIVSNQVFRTSRIDLTEEKLYTLSNASQGIIKDLNDPVKLKFYFSSTDAANVPSLKYYGEHVLDLLESYQKRSKNLALEVYDPRPDSDESGDAEQYGLTGIPVATGDVLFCGLVVANEMGDEEAIAYFDPQREEFLEYDITKAIATVATTQKTVVGLYSPLSLEGSQPNPYAPAQGQGAAEPWFFTFDLKQLYDVRILTDLHSIPDDITLLVLVHPKGLDEKDEYTIDQYLMHGRNALIFVDPYCESDSSQPMGMMGMGGMDRSSHLPRTLSNAGINMPGGQVILDRERAAQVQTGPNQLANYYAWLNLTAMEVDSEDSVTGQLETLLFPYAGFFTFDASKTKNLNIQTLIHSSKTANKSDTAIFQFGGSPDRIAQAYQPGDTALPLAVRISGTFSSVFPEGRPDLSETGEDTPGEDTEKEEEKEEEEKEILRPHRKTASGTSSLILVADTDFISNRFSLNIANFLGNVMVSPLNDNMNFLFNALESLSGSTKLSEIRSRGKFSRPFTRVMEIESRAQARWMNEEQALNEKVNRVQQKMNDLMKRTDESSVAVADQNILNEIENFRREKKETQRRLREVRKNLRQEKEVLGTRLFLFNTFFIPILFLIYGVIHLVKLRTRT